MKTIINTHMASGWKRPGWLGMSLITAIYFGSFAFAQETPQIPGDSPQVTNGTPPPETPATPATTPPPLAVGDPTPTAPAAASKPKPKKQVLSFENADLRVILQALAKQAGMSLVIPEDVRGTITARLVDIPIEKAMKTILESKGYSLIELDGVYHVKSKEAIAAEPVKTEVYQFANASAREVKPTVDKLLTRAGNSQLDERSNSLIITDVPSNLTKVIPIIKTLDTATPQIMIETKLLEMTRNPREAVGVNWQSLASYQIDIATPLNVATGSGDSQLSSGRLVGGVTRSGDAGAIGSSDSGRRGGVLTTIGLAGYPFAAVLDAPAFSTTLSFLLQDSDTELLGSPKVITSDNKEAKIVIATQEPIPNFTFNQQTASFVISGFEFKNIGNVLTVTPHVNKEEFITLDVEPQVSTAQTGANGRTFALPGGTVSIPLISIRTLNSRVMVKSGHTLALGGLLEASSTRAYSKVPFVGDIPLLGEFFRHRSLEKIKRNLLIFITPTIIPVGEKSGLEDQYTQLKETNPDDRFAYKKTYMGNAKPLDQFMPYEQRRDNLSAIELSPQTGRNNPDSGESAVIPNGEPEPLIAPVVAPGLRD
jgi:type IV pilus secretin PilQ/predicted competence protein